MKIFISYKQNVVPDHGLAQSLEKSLYEAYYMVFRDQSRLMAGIKWEKLIEDNLRDSDVLLCLMTNASMKSKSVLREIDLALNLGIMIIPVMIEPLKSSAKRNYDSRNLDKFQHIKYTGDYHLLVDNIIASAGKCVEFILKKHLQTMMKKHNIRDPLDVLSAFLYLLQDLYLDTKRTSRWPGAPKYCAGLGNGNINMHKCDTLVETMAVASKDLYHKTRFFEYAEGQQAGEDHQNMALRCGHLKEPYDFVSELLTSLLPEFEKADREENEKIEKIKNSTGSNIVIHMKDVK